MNKKRNNFESMLSKMGSDLEDKVKNRIEDDPRQREKMEAIRNHNKKVESIRQSKNSINDLEEEY